MDTIKHGPTGHSRKSVSSQEAHSADVLAQSHGNWSNFITI